MLESVKKIHGSQTPPRLIMSSGDTIFKTGEIFTGTILKRFSSGEVLIAAKGKEFPAKTDLRLEPGTRYQFQAVKVGQKIELRIVEDSAREQGQLQELWSLCRKDGQKMGELLRELSHFQNMRGIPAELSKRLSDFNLLLPVLTYQGENTPKAAWFAAFLLNSGLFWESKLARLLSTDKKASARGPAFEDLKGYLLSLKGILNSGAENSEAAPSLTEKIDQVLRIIGQEQRLNLALQRNDLGWYWFIPGLGEETFKRAEILVNQDAAEGVIRFCLMIDFSRLGRVMAEFLLAEANLELSFLVENKDIEAFINEHISELREGLEGKGFSPGTISCRTDEEIENYMAHLLEERGSGGAFHLVI